MKFLSLVIVVTAVLLSGCSVYNSMPWQEAKINIDNSKRLRVGMTKDKVLEIMGEPLKGERYSGPDIWFYYSGTEWLDGMRSDDECLPLVFENGKLIGWGRKFYTGYRTKLPNKTSEIPLDNLR